MYPLNGVYRQAASVIFCHSGIIEDLIFLFAIHLKAI